MDLGYCRIYLCLYIEIMLSNNKQIGTLPGNHIQPGRPANKKGGWTNDKSKIQRSRLGQ